jgi:hypothetical protein
MQNKELNMKKISMILVALLAQLMFAELINMNPDPNGEPWWAGGWKNPTAEEMTKINNIPKLKLPAEYKNKIIPYKLDNTSLGYFRPIFNQMGGSCAQASGVGYNFTYEMNHINGTSANITDNQYPTHYTYNFLNDGSGDIGSTYFGGWDIINAGGIPNVSTYGGLWPSTDAETMYKIWMNGFEGYKSGMEKRIIETVSIPVGTPEGLQTLKQYFNDYCDGSATGGIVNFSAGISWVEIDVLPVGTEEAGKSILWKWDPSVNHAMTFVGYNDSIRFDYNGDGKCTNDIDTNGDDIVDMKDWEIGAILMANSWGSAWYNAGKIWVAYRTLALSLEEGGIWTNTVYTIRVRDNFEPSLYLKSTINFSDRKELKIYAGVSSDTTATVPDHTVSFPYFNYQGGAGVGMAGDGTTLEFGLDISPLLSYIERGSKAKFFLCVDHSEDGTSGRGSLVSFSISDSSGTEFISSQSNVSILKNATTYMSVNAVLDFNAPSIADETLPDADPGVPYSHTLSAADGNAPYRWDVICDYNEVENTGEFLLNTENQLTMTNDDDGYAVIDLPFKFPFYGKLYDKVTVITDGSIKLDEGFDYIRSEGDILAFKTITAYGADLMSYPEDGDGVFYSVDSECLTVRWITSLFDVQDVNLDFEIKIYADSRIEFFYGDALTTGLYWASGISNGKVTDAVISSLSNVSDPSGLKTSFSTDPYPYGLELSSEGVFSGITYVPDGSWNILFRVTDDRNISDLKQLSFSTLSGIDDPAEHTVSDFKLNQNYPNPFNPSTKISFNLKNSQTVSLRIFNSFGQVVDTLIENRLLGKGNHSFEWKADKLTSGVYYFGLESENGMKQIRKMTVLK